VREVWGSPAAAQYGLRPPLGPNYGPTATRRTANNASADKSASPSPTRIARRARHRCARSACEPTANRTRAPPPHERPQTATRTTSPMLSLARSPSWQGGGLLPSLVAPRPRFPAPRRDIPQVAGGAVVYAPAAGGWPSIRREMCPCATCRPRAARAHVHGESIPRRAGALCGGTVGITRVSAASGGVRTCETRAGVWPGVHRPRLRSRPRSRRRRVAVWARGSSALGPLVGGRVCCWRGACVSGARRPVCSSSVAAPDPVELLKR